MTSDSSSTSGESVGSSDSSSVRDVSTYPSMPAVRAAAKRRAAMKIAAMDQGEAIVYLRQLGLARQSAQFSGVPEWTVAHTIGALQATQAIMVGADMARKAGVLDYKCWETMHILIQEQEIVCVMLESDDTGA